MVAGEKSEKPKPTVLKIQKAAPEWRRPVSGARLGITASDWNHDSGPASGHWPGVLTGTPLTPLTTMEASPE